MVKRKKTYCQTLNLAKDTFEPAKCIGCWVPKTVIDCKKYLARKEAQ